MKIFPWTRVVLCLCLCLCLLVGCVAEEGGEPVSMDPQPGVDAPQPDPTPEPTAEPQPDPSPEAEPDPAPVPEPDEVPPAEPDPQPEQPPESEGFDQLFSEVFVAQGCTAGYCHGAGQGGLSMVGVDDSFEALVDVVAFNPMCGFEQLVVPGDPEQSLLWHRVLPVEEGQGEPCVPKMPAGTSGLSVEDAQRVYDWIAAGAPR